MEYSDPHRTRLAVLAPPSRTRSRPPCTQRPTTRSGSVDVREARGRVRRARRVRRGAGSGVAWAEPDHAVEAGRRTDARPDDPARRRTRRREHRRVPAGGRPGRPGGREHRRRGIVRPVEALGHVPGHASILGGGATAASALTAAVRLGAVDVRLFLRDTAKAGALVDLAVRLGVTLEVLPVSALPGTRTGSSCRRSPEARRTRSSCCRRGRTPCCSTWPTSRGRPSPRAGGRPRVGAC